MTPDLRQSFFIRWQKYFGPVELPITFEYTNEERGIPLVDPVQETRCVIGVLQKARAGTSLRFGATSFGCLGGKTYCGYSPSLRRNIGEFLSHDAQGEGERYKKSPEIATRAIEHSGLFPASAKYLIVKRWDHLTEEDDPVAVIFFAMPDVLSGLFTLAGYDVADPEGAVAIPFSAGCGSIIKYANIESQKEKPRAILGMFDVSARPYVDANTLTFAVPMKKFTSMVENMDESFLITESWRKVQTRFVHS